MLILLIIVSLVASLAGYIYIAGVVYGAVDIAHENDRSMAAIIWPIYLVCATIKSVGDKIISSGKSAGRRLKKSTLQTKQPILKKKKKKRQIELPYQEYVATRSTGPTTGPR